MSYFNFNRLITKYSAQFTLITSSKGSYVGGHYVKGEDTQTTRSGAIMSLSETKVYQSGGTLTSQDRRLFVTEPITDALEGCKVLFNGDEYSIEEDREKGNERFTGVYSYLLKRVSSFDTN